MSRFIIVIILLSVALAAPAGVVQVDVPAHVEWCATVVVPEKNALNTQEAQQEVFRRGQAPIALCARNAMVERIGVPFVRDVKVNPKKESEVSLTFCSVMKGETQPCAGIEKQNVSVTQVLAAVCPRDTSAACLSEVTAALRAEPFNLDDMAIERVQFRFVATTSSSATPESIGAALNSSDTQVVFGKTQATEVVEEPLPFVVVTAPLPKVAPPPKEEKP
jgi:hypothetical protein